MKNVLLFVILIVIGFLIVISFGMLSACGPEIKVTKVNGDDTKEGFRYYRPHPYLLVTYDPNDPNSNPKGEILWLPNTNEEYAVSAKANWGKVELKLTLVDGWKLTEVGNTADSEVQETIQAFTGLFKEAASMGLLPKEKQREREEIGARLFRFNFNQEGYVENLTEVKIAK